MQDLIDVYIEKKYTEEAKELLYAAIGIFAVYNYSEPLGDMVDLVSMQGEIEEVGIVDGVRGYVERGIDRLLEVNRVRVGDEVTFRERIRILEGIFALTKINDPDEYLPLFSGWLSNEEIFAKTIGIALDEPYEDFYVQLTWVYEGTIKNLREYLENMKTENETVEFELIKDIRKNLQCFLKVFGIVPIADSLTEMNILKGQPFKTYLNLFQDEIVDAQDMENTVYGLLWLALISSSGYRDPKSLLLEESKALFTDYKDYTLFNNMVTKALGLYLPAREVF